MLDIVKLYELAIGCPCGVRSANCPFLRVDHNLFSEKVEWVNNLSDEEVSEILQNHVKCLKARKFN